MDLLIRVIHSPKLAMRLQNISNLVERLQADKRFKLNVEFIKEYEPEKLDTETISMYVKLENPKTNTFLDTLVRNMHINQVSQALKHTHALEQLSSAGTELMLVIEDDVLFGESITDELHATCEQFMSNPSADVVFLGCPTPKTLGEKKQLVQIKDVFRVLPTADAYLVKKSSVTKLKTAFAPIRFPTPIQFTYVALTQGVNAFMAAPNIFVNGSKYGVYLSSTDQNNKLFMNQDFNNMLNINLKPSISREDSDVFTSMTTNAKFLEHPDFQHQIALFYARAGQLEKAKAHFETAFKIYEENGCIMTNESEFLLNYTRIFRFFQNI